MKKEYDLKKLNLKPNPYLSKLKKTTTMRLDVDVLAYFKNLAEIKEVPYQSLINNYLRYCMDNKLEPKTIWKKPT